MRSHICPEYPHLTFHVKITNAFKPLLGFATRKLNLRLGKVIIIVNILTPTRKIQNTLHHSLVIYLRYIFVKSPRLTLALSPPHFCEKEIKINTLITISPRISFHKILQIAYDYGVPLSASFFILAGSTVFFLINTILLPRKHIPWPLPENYELQGCCAPSPREEHSSSNECLESKYDPEQNLSSDKYTVPEKNNHHHGVQNKNYRVHANNTCDYDNPGYENNEGNEGRPRSVIKDSSLDVITCFCAWSENFSLLLFVFVQREWKRI